MDKPISVGDLVQVVKPMPCCGAAASVGWMFTVLKIRHSPSSHCTHCGKNCEPSMVVDVGLEWVFDIPRLKRIPPANELEGVRDASGLDERLPTKVPA